MCALGVPSAIFPPVGNGDVGPGVFKDVGRLKDFHFGIGWCDRGTHGCGASGWTDHIR